MGLDGVPGVLIRGQCASGQPPSGISYVSRVCTKVTCVCVCARPVPPRRKVCGWWRERGLACDKKQCGYHVCAAERAEGAQPPGHGGQRNHARHTGCLMCETRLEGMLTCYDSGPWQVPLALAGAFVAVYWPTGLRIDRRIPARWQGLLWISSLLRISSLQRRRRVPLAHAGLLIAVHRSTALRVDLRIPAWWQVLLRRISAWVDRALVGLLIAIVLRIPARLLLQQQVRGTRAHCLICCHRLPLHRRPRDREGASEERRKRREHFAILSFVAFVPE